MCATSTHSWLVVCTHSPLPCQARPLPDCNLVISLRSSPHEHSIRSIECVCWFVAFSLYPHSLFMFALNIITEQQLLSFPSLTSPSSAKVANNKRSRHSLFYLAISFFHSRPSPNCRVRGYSIDRRVMTRAKVRGGDIVSKEGNCGRGARLRREECAER